MFWVNSYWLVSVPSKIASPLPSGIVIRLSSKSKVKSVKRVRSAAWYTFRLADAFCTQATQWTFSMFQAGRMGKSIETTTESPTSLSVMFWLPPARTTWL